MKGKSCKLLAVLVGLVVLLATVAAQDNQPDTTVNFFFSQSQFSEEGVGRRLLMECMEQYPNIELEMTYAFGPDWGNAFLAFASSNDLPDVFGPTDAFTLAEMLVNDWVQPLDGLVAGDFASRFPEGTFVEGINMADGEIYSFPLQIANFDWIMAYNKDLMSQAGLDPNNPPKTWDELLQMSKAITEAGNGQYYGLGLPLQNAFPYGTILSWMYGLQPSMDGDGFDYQEGRYVFDSPNVTRAVEFLLELRDAGSIHPDAVAWTLNDAQGAFANEQVAFFFTQHWLVRAMNIGFEAGDVNYAIAPVPQVEEDIDYNFIGTGANSNIFVSSTTENPEAAGKVVDCISSEHFFTERLQEEFLLPPIEVNEYPNVQLEQMVEVYQNSGRLRPIPESTPSGLLVRQLEAAMPAPQPDWWNVVQGAYTGSVQDWEARLEQINEAYNQRFERAIEQAQAEGAEVSREDFTFPDFGGTENYNYNSDR